MFTIDPSSAQKRSEKPGTLSHAPFVRTGERESGDEGARIRAAVSQALGPKLLLLRHKADAGDNLGHYSTPPRGQGRAGTTSCPNTARLRHLLDAQEAPRAPFTAWMQEPLLGLERNRIRVTVYLVLVRDRRTVMKREVEYFNLSSSHRASMLPQAA